MDDSPDMTAAELSLGLLDGDERAAATRRLLAEPGFAAEVEWWRGQWAPLFAIWPEVPPPAELERRVMAGLDAAGASVVPLRREPWRAIAAALAACLAVAVGVAVFTAMRPKPAPVVPVARTTTAPAPLLAAIVPTGTGTPLSVAYDPATGALRLAGTVAVPESSVAELWVIGKDATPRSLGLIRGDGPTRLAVASIRRAALVGGATLAVSIEPPGGSPTGLPTGPVVATGTLVAA